MKTAFLRGLANGEIDPHHDRDEDFDLFVQNKLAEVS